MRDDTQLTQEECYQIEALLKMEHHQSEIAVVLKRHKSTISREVRRSQAEAAAGKLLLASCCSWSAPRPLSSNAPGHCSMRWAIQYCTAARWEAVFA